jgi:amino-acid N-acetyltransferase
MTTTDVLHSLALKVAVNEEERQKAIALLQEHDLPVSDIDEDKLLYLLVDGKNVIGTAGLEIFDDCALLRSVSVIKREQGKGNGKFINEEIEKYTMESGITCLYLLTTTAKTFFENLGYCEIKRDNAPESVKRTAEFKTLCSSTAVLMRKRL